MRSNFCSLTHPKIMWMTDTLQSNESWCQIVALIRPSRAMHKGPGNIIEQGLRTFGIKSLSIFKSHLWLLLCSHYIPETERKAHSSQTKLLDGWLNFGILSMLFTPVCYNEWMKTQKAWKLDDGCPLCARSRVRVSCHCHQVLCHGGICWVSRNNIINKLI